MSEIIRKFNIFRDFSPNIQQNIKSFYVSSDEFGYCVTNDNKVYGFGDNINEMLGYDCDTDYTEISELCEQNIEEFYEGYLYMFAKNAQNQIYSWGFNQDGQLCRGYKSDNNLKPQKIDFFDDKSIIQISCGIGHSLALSSSSLIYGCGDNQYGQIDWQGANDFISFPIMIDLKQEIRNIYCARGTSFAVTVEGYAYYWGLINNEWNEKLGKNKILLENEVMEEKEELIESEEYVENELILEDTDFMDVPIIINPRLISIKNVSKIVYFSLDEECIIILDIFGNLFEFNGIEEKIKEIHCEEKLSDLYVDNRVIDECVLQGDTVFVYNDSKLEKTVYNTLFEYFLFEKQKSFKTIQIKGSKLFTFEYLKSDANPKNLVKTEKQINYSNDNNFKTNEEKALNLKSLRISTDLPKISESNVKLYYQSGGDSGNSDNYFAFFVMNNNEVYAYGHNTNGKLGFGHQNRMVCENTIIPELCAQNIQEFYEGYYCMFARNDRNEILSWGYDKYGTLARGCDSGQFLKPANIEFFNDKNIIQISCGYHHCLGLSSRGIVYGWGYNKQGQVGCGEDNCFISTPIIIELKTQIKIINCSDHNSSVVNFDGYVYYWGLIQKKWNEEKRAVEEICQYRPRLIQKENCSKICSYYASGYFIILLDINGNIFNFNAFEEKIHEIICEEILNDLYHDYFYYRDDCCLFQSDDCVYQFELEDNTLRKTNFINFYDFYSEKSHKYRKTIHITNDGLLITKEIKFNDENEETLIIDDKNVFDNKYDNLFEFMNKIGSGAFGEVLKVFKKSNAIVYAIKKVELNNFEVDIKEIKLMSKLNSDFVVRYIDSWVEAKYIFKFKKFLFIQMEVCSQNLTDILKSMNSITEEKYKIFNYFISCELFKELIECVNYLHSIPIIHRDLKPENILISNGINGRFLKLCDFGFSTLHEKPFHTRMVGTDTYMAPEVRDGTHYDLKSDIYSLALIAIGIFQIQDPIKQIKLKNDYYNYATKGFEQEFINLLKLLEVCIYQESEHHEKRPDSKQLMEKFNDIIIDKNIVKSDTNISEYRETLRNINNQLLTFLFEFKLDNSIINKIFIEQIYYNQNSQAHSSKNIEISESSIYENMFNEICELGSGMFGTVFKVINKSTNETFAIKKIQIETEMDLKEMNIISSFDKNNCNDFIVKYINMWTEKRYVFKTITEFLFIQMELCSQNLRDVLESMNSITEEKYKTFNYFISCELFKELIECVNYLHSIPIIHRDLKPENILISNGINGRFLKLCDFGFSKIHQMSVHTRMVGTDSYMAPEVRDSCSYNTKSDIYSLALIATEIFQFNDSLKTIRNTTDLNKYFIKYSKTILENNFKQLLETLFGCLLIKDYNSRPNCGELLKKIHEISVNKNVVLDDKNYSDFKIFMDNTNISFIKMYFNNKIEKRCLKRKISTENVESITKQ